MCEQCAARTSLYVLEGQKNHEVLPGYALVRATVDSTMMKAGDWGLVRCNDPDFVWTVTPKPDKFWGISDAELDLLPDHEQDAITAWDCYVSEFGKQILQSYVSSRGGSYFKGIEVIMAACKKKGWKSSKDPLEYWLFHYLGLYIENAVERKFDEAAP